MQMIVFDVLYPFFLRIKDMSRNDGFSFLDEISTLSPPAEEGFLVGRPMNSSNMSA
jgi:hypothetical protein